MFNKLSIIQMSTFAQSSIFAVMMMVFGTIAWTSCFNYDLSDKTNMYSEKAHRTYQVNWIATSRMSVEDSNDYTPFPLAMAIQAEVEGLETVAQVQLFGNGFLQTGNQPAVRLDEIAFATPELLDVFEFNTIDGDLQHALTTQNEVALSESTAKRLFGNNNPIGQTIHFNRQLDLTVTSVFEDPKHGAYATAQVLISYASLNEDILGGFPMDTWTDERKGQVYVVTKKNQVITPIHTQLEKIARTYTHKTSHLSADNTFVLKAFKDIYQAPKTLLKNGFAMK